MPVQRAFGCGMMDASSEEEGQRAIGLPPGYEALLTLFGWDEATARLRNTILAECAVSMFRVLWREVGLSRALEVTKPLNMVNGRKLASDGRDYVRVRSGLQYDQAMEVAMPLFWLHCGTSDGRCSPLKVGEGMAVGEVYSCPFALVDAPPEACMAISHPVSDGITEGTNPEFEYVWTHHLANQDGRCRYVVKRRSVKSTLSDHARFERTIPVFRMSQQERDILGLAVVFQEFNVLTLASVNAIGSQLTMELSAPLARKTGAELGSKLKEEVGSLGDPMVIRDKLNCLGTMFGQAGEPAVVTDTGIERETSYCPFTLGPPEIRAHMRELFRGVCEAVNPDYELTYDRIMTRGDATCHSVVRRRERRPDEEPEEKGLKIVRI